MNEAVEEDQDADIEESDAESRRFLREVGAAAGNATSQPWSVGQAGQQVRHPANHGSVNGMHLCYRRLEGVMAVKCVAKDARGCATIPKSVLAVDHDAAPCMLGCCRSWRSTCACTFHLVALHHKGW